MDHPTRYEAGVLAVLHPGGQLTVNQIADQTGRAPRSVRSAVNRLRTAGYLTPAPGRDAWQLSPTGVAFLKTATGRTVLEFGR